MGGLFAGLYCIGLRRVDLLCWDSESYLWIDTGWFIVISLCAYRRGLICCVLPFCYFVICAVTRLCCLHVKLLKFSLGWCVLPMYLDWLV